MSSSQLLTGVTRYVLVLLACCELNKPTKPIIQRNLDWRAVFSAPFEFKDWLAINTTIKL